MKRGYLGAGVATAVLVVGAFAGSGAMAQTENETVSTTVGAKGVKDPDAPRGRLAASPAQGGLAPQDVIAENGVNRVFGDNRYATAVAVAETYGWTYENTSAVYIASGMGYADALAIGPSMLGDGPLLLVRDTKIPDETREALELLQPCFIDVMGGTVSVSDGVFEELQQYAHPELCPMEP